MARSNEPIYWFPELTEEAESLTDEFLAQIFAPIIRSRLEQEAQANACVQDADVKSKTAHSL